MIRCAASDKGQYLPLVSPLVCWTSVISDESPSRCGRWMKGDQMCSFAQKLTFVTSTSRTCYPKDSK